MVSREECTCPCHRNPGMVHTMACCTIAKKPMPYHDDDHFAPIPQTDLTGD